MRSIQSSFIFAAAALAIFAPLASAHPGHGAATGLTAGLAHPFTGLDHILAMIAVGALGVRIGGKAVWALPITFICLMVAGGLLPLAGVKVPLIEQAIAASVLVLGVLLAVASRIPLAPATALVALFAIFHGYAHVSEMPSTHSALAYATGFILATAILHLIGVAIALAARRAPHGSHLLRLGGIAVALSGVFLLAVA